MTIYRLAKKESEFTLETSFNARLVMPPDFWTFAAILVTFAALFCGYHTLRFWSALREEE